MAIVAAQSVSHFFLEAVEDAKRSRASRRDRKRDQVPGRRCSATSFTPTGGRARRSNDP